MHIEVLPPWWDTWWFRSFYGVLLACAVWSAYRIRVRQVSRQVTIRMEERIAERTRIAQDLHDTLLQGLLSASLQLAVANTQLPAEAAAKPLVSRVYAMLRQLIEEGRNTVRGLRIRHLEPAELERAISSWNIRATVFACSFETMVAESMQTWSDQAGRDTGD